MCRLWKSAILSGHTNTLTVRGTGSTVLFTDGGWSAPTAVTLSGTSFLQYTNGSAILNVQSALAPRLAVISLASLNGTTGFRLDGVAAFDFSGRSVNYAGDVNGDGFDDLIIGASDADPRGNASAVLATSCLENLLVSHRRSTCQRWMARMAFGSTGR
ncbi:MAG: FG-GAP repeat protein [Planctomycetaceae bacterium]